MPEHSAATIHKIYEMSPKGTSLVPEIPDPGLQLKYVRSFKVLGLRLFTDKIPMQITLWRIPMVLPNVQLAASVPSTPTIVVRWDTGDELGPIL